jgi:hypothetical protein
MRRIVVLLVALAAFLPGLPVADAYVMPMFVMRGSRSTTFTVTLQRDMWLRDVEREGSGSYQVALIHDAAGHLIYAGFWARGWTDDAPFEYSTQELRFKKGARLRFTFATDRPGEYRWKMFLAGATQIHKGTTRAPATAVSWTAADGMPNTFASKQVKTSARSTMFVAYKDSVAPGLASLFDDFCLVAHKSGDCREGTRATPEGGGGNGSYPLGSVGDGLVLYKPGHPASPDLVSQRFSPDSSGRRKVYAVAVG